MRTKAFVAATLIISTQTLYGIVASRAADLLWEVENPYRFFKRTSSFEVQERVFNAVRGATGQPLPANILWRVERRLNDPDCKDASTPDNCLATARPGFEKSRLGWAAQTVDLNCYDRNARPRRYLVTCDRQYSWGTAREDYILPDAHTVVMHIAPEQLAAAGPGDTVLDRLESGELTVRQAAAEMGVSEVWARKLRDDRRAGGVVEMHKS
jgi:hypothetical protein